METLKKLAYKIKSARLLAYVWLRQDGIDPVTAWRCATDRYLSPEWERRVNAQ